MSVPVEEHHRHRIIELVHGVEVRHFSDVHYVHHYEVAELGGCFEHNLIHLHALWVPVVSESDNNQLLALIDNGLVDLPAII